MVSPDMKYQSSRLKDPLSRKIIRTVVSGSCFTHFLTTTGELFTIGRNPEGQLGLGCDIKEINTPQSISLGGQPVTKIARGGNHSLAVTTNNELYVWGDGRNGRLGTNSEDPVFIP